MARQIPMDLAPDPDFSFSTLEIGESNRSAVTLVQSWPQWPSPILLICGPEGSGKTHLGSAWAQAYKGLVFERDTHIDPAHMDATTCAFIDNADDIAEDDLFTVMNAALNGKMAGILLAAENPPALWGVDLPDLRSRLVNTPIARLSDHDDDILEHIIRKLFEDRGRVIKSDLVSYLMKNQDRSVGAMTAVVERLDFAASEAKRDLTRAFAASILRS